MLVLCERRVQPSNVLYRIRFVPDGQVTVQYYMCALILAAMILEMIFSNPNDCLQTWLNLPDAAVTDACAEAQDANTQRDVLSTPMFWWSVVTTSFAHIFVFFAVILIAFWIPLIEIITFWLRAAKHPAWRAERALRRLVRPLRPLLPNRAIIQLVFTLVIAGAVFVGFSHEIQLPWDWYSQILNSMPIAANTAMIARWLVFAILGVWALDKVGRLRYFLPRRHAPAIDLFLRLVKVVFRVAAIAWPPLLFMLFVYLWVDDRESVGKTMLVGQTFFLFVLGYLVCPLTLYYLVGKQPRTHWIKSSSSHTELHRHDYFYATASLSFLSRHGTEAQSKRKSFWGKSVWVTCIRLISILDSGVLNLARYDGPHNRQSAMADYHRSVMISKNSLHETYSYLVLVAVPVISGFAMIFFAAIFGLTEPRGLLWATVVWICLATYYLSYELRRLERYLYEAKSDVPVVETIQPSALEMATRDKEIEQFKKRFEQLFAFVFITMLITLITIIAGLESRFAG